MTASLSLLRSARLDALPGIAAGFSTRAGGVSTGAYGHGDEGGLNLGRSTADTPESVEENRRRFAAAFGLSMEQAAIAGQVHSTVVQTAGAPGLYGGTDGLVTATPGLLLCITAADCAAVLFADADARVVGACHAGWRGAVGGIVEETLRQMTALGADPARVVAAIGPCISQDAFEVGPEVAAHFGATRVRPGTGDRHHADLTGEIMDRLTAAGISPDRIDASDACTATDPDGRFYSHRASGGTTGRMMGAIALTA